MTLTLNDLSALFGATIGIAVLLAIVSALIAVLWLVLTVWFRERGHK